MPFFVERHIYIGYYTPFDIEPAYPYPGLVPFYTPGIDPRGLDVELPPDAFPQLLRAGKRTKNMPDLLSVLGFEVVCEEFRDCVQELEPDLHQFSSKLTVLYKDGRPTEKSYYAIVPRHHLRRTTIPEQATARLSSGGQHRTTLTGLKIWKDHLVLDEAVIGGRHLWKDRDFYPSQWFVSDELGKRIQKARLKAFELTHHRLGRREQQTTAAESDAAIGARVHDWGAGAYIIGGRP